MNELFGYPEYSMLGERVLTNQKNKCTNMLMDISAVQMAEGDVKKWFSATDECAILLIQGAVTFQWQGKSETVVRTNCFNGPGFCLHIPKGIEVVVTANGASEVLFQSTDNETVFEPVFYTPENSRVDRAGEGVLGNTAVRDIVTYVDYDNAPYSNLVIGEVISNPGGWSGYLPHSHRQPEVYYYHFDHPNGFGACFIGEDVFKATDGSFCAIPGGLMHPQVSAPGYRMFYVWMIRHLPNDPWVSRDLDPKHTWLLEQ